MVRPTDCKLGMKLVAMQEQYRYQVTPDGMVTVPEHLTGTLGGTAAKSSIDGIASKYLSRYKYRPIKYQHKMETQLLPMNIAGAFPLQLM